MLKVINGDLFDADAKYLCHQCNCVTSRAAHLAYDVFKNYPYADVYSCRQNKADYSYYRDVPGDIIIRGNGEDQRYVIAILGQFYPGNPSYPNSDLDGSKARERYFYQALLKIAKIPDLESIAFPYGIGCGAAGGNWDVYFKILNNFANHLDGKADVLIYKKD